MKILALSDEVLEPIYSPQIRQKYADVDLVIACGDLPFYYLEFVVTMLSVPLYYVPGNHDKPTQYRSDGRMLSHAEGCLQLDGEVLRARLPDDQPTGEPLLLAGLGGCLRYNQDAAHQYTQPDMHRRALQLAPRLLANRLANGRFLDILVTHAPPRGIHDQPDRTHTGFDAFRWMMDVFQPRLLLHGHAHVYRNDRPTLTQYRNTRVVNVYPARVLEWEQPHA